MDEKKLYKRLRNEFYKKLIKRKRLLEYIKVIIIPRFRFKRAIIKAKKKYLKHKVGKSILLSYPMSRYIGKSTLIGELSQTHHLEVLTKYRNFVPRNAKCYMRITPHNMYNLCFDRGDIYLVDDLEPVCAKYLIDKGLVLIGYLR